MEVVQTASRGEGFSIVVTPRVSGQTLSVWLKRRTSGNGIPPRSQAADVVCVITPYPTEAEGWAATVTPAMSAALTPGQYVGDARIVSAGGDVNQSDPFLVIINESVTAS